MPANRIQADDGIYRSSLSDLTTFHILVRYIQKSSAKLLEGAILVFYFSLFVHLTTAASLSSGTLAYSAGLVLFAAGMSLLHVFGRLGFSRPLWILLSALAGGFWLFSLFRFLGLAEWPLSRAVDMTGYIRLLYFHFVLATSVLTPVVITSSITAGKLTVSWGRWTGRLASIPFGAVLWVGLFGIWIWAFIELVTIKPDASGPIIGLVAVAFLKASLNGATEEVCFRGLIQPAAVARYGVPMGILFQGCLYTVFHMHIEEAFFSRLAFLSGVMALGLVFGVVTRMSGGIGWSLTVHTAINLVIEWRNLS